MRRESTIAVSGGQASVRHGRRHPRDDHVRPAADRIACSRVTRRMPASGWVESWM